MIPNPVVPFGLAFLHVEIVRRRPFDWLREKPQEIHSNATVGMVWLSLQRCGEYVPGDWFQPVMFERVDA